MSSVQRLADETKGEILQSRRDKGCMEGGEGSQALVYGGGERKE